MEPQEYNRHSTTNVIFLQFFYSKFQSKYKTKNNFDEPKWLRNIESWLGYLLAFEKILTWINFFGLMIFWLMKETGSKTT